MDQNGNGSISPDEILDPHKARLDEIAQELSENKEGMGEEAAKIKRDMLEFMRDRYEQERFHYEEMGEFSIDQKVKDILGFDDNNDGHMSFNEYTRQKPPQLAVPDNADDLQLPPR